MIQPDSEASARHPILSTEALDACVATFNRNDQELYRQHIPIDRLAVWMGRNIPLLECPDNDIEEIYYIFIFPHSFSSLDGRRIRRAADAPEALPAC